MNEIKIKKDDMLLFPEHSMFLFLQENCELSDEEFVFSEDITAAYNDFLGLNKYYSNRFVISLVMKIFPALKRTAKKNHASGEHTIRRGLQGLILTKE